MSDKLPQRNHSIDWDHLLETNNHPAAVEARSPSRGKSRVSVIVDPKSCLPELSECSEGAPIPSVFSDPPTHISLMIRKALLLWFPGCNIETMHFIEPFSTFLRVYFIAANGVRCNAEVVYVQNRLRATQIEYPDAVDRFKGPNDHHRSFPRSTTKQAVFTGVYRSGPNPMDFMSRGTTKGGIWCTVRSKRSMTTPNGVSKDRFMVDSFTNAFVINAIDTFCLYNIDSFTIESLVCLYDGQKLNGLIERLYMPGGIADDVRNRATRDIETQEALERAAGQVEVMPAPAARLKQTATIEEICDDVVDEITTTVLSEEPTDAGYGVDD
jgi:hypothetical protein